MKGKREASTAPPEQGTLDATPLPGLLLALYRRRAAGRLDLAREGVAKRVWLRDGVPVLAESNLPSESLGIQLLDAGRIGRDDYARLVTAVRERGCREGAALLSMGLIGPQDLFTALKDQVRRRLLDCLGWPRGEWHFDPSDPPAADATAFRCDPVALTHEGVAIHWSPAQLRTALADRMGRYPERTPRFAALAGRLHADADVARLLEALDGTRTLGDALGPAPGPTALAAIWVLDALEAAVWRDAPVAPAAARADAGDGDDDEPDFEIVVGGAGAGPAEEAAADAPRTAAVGRPAAIAPDAEALRREIGELHATLRERDHYQMLGLERDAPVAAVKRAYFAAAKRFHPDALGALGLADLRAPAQAVFARIAQAYEVLADPARRRDYDQGLAGEGDAGEAARLMQAEALYRKGEVLLRAGNFNGAHEFLGPAVALYPGEAAYQSALGWALYKKRPSDPKAARTHLEQAIALDGRDAVAHFRLGLVLRALGDEAAAQRALELAKRLDPKVK
jgi:tetratricopeptide (TPR) repeat protein